MKSVVQLKGKTLDRGNLFPTIFAKVMDFIRSNKFFAIFLIKIAIICLKAYE